MIDKIEFLEGVIGVIIGHSYGGKSLGKQSRTRSAKVQRIEVGGIKAATQSAKGLQELFIRTKADQEEAIAEKIATFFLSHPVFVLPHWA
jgi:predicted alpha/beta hydrolase